MSESGPPSGSNPPSPLARSLVEGQRRDNLREKYRTYLQEVWKKPDNCPVCDSTYWSLGDPVDMQLRGITAALMDIPATRKVYVYAPVTCLYCGFTMFFHTGILDVRGTEKVKAIPPLRAPEEER